MNLTAFEKFTQELAEKMVQSFMINIEKQMKKAESKEKINKVLEIKDEI